MVLNYIWVAFFLIAFVVALAKLILFNDTAIFQALVTSTFDSAKLSVEISIGLVGVMALWLGLMRIGEKGGVIAIFAKFVGPFFNRLFPELPRNLPVFGSILMNFSANMIWGSEAVSLTEFSSCISFMAFRPMWATKRIPSGG